MRVHLTKCTATCFFSCHISESFAANHAVFECTTTLISFLKLSNVVTLQSSISAPPPSPVNPSQRTEPSWGQSCCGYLSWPELCKFIWKRKPGPSPPPTYRRSSNHSWPNKLCQGQGTYWPVFRVNGRASVSHWKPRILHRECCLVEDCSDWR